MKFAGFDTSQMGLAHTYEYAQSIAMEVRSIETRVKGRDEHLVRQHEYLVLYPVSLNSTSLPTGRSVSLLGVHNNTNSMNVNLSGRSSEYQRSQNFLYRTLENMSMFNVEANYMTHEQLQMVQNDSYKLDLQCVDGVEEKRRDYTDKSKITKLITSIQGNIARSSIYSIKGSLIDLTVE